MFEELRRFITERYDLAEFRTLCADLGVPFEDLDGERTSVKARELILHMGRRQQLEHLLDYLARTRREAFDDGVLSPDASFVSALYESLPSATGEAAPSRQQALWPHVASAAQVSTIPDAVLQNAMRHRLPLQRPPRTANFTGRVEDIARLLVKLSPGHVVTLVGPGGIGKTALAAEAVWQLSPREGPPEVFSDGILFHSFYNRPEAAVALEHFARSYGEEPKPTPAVAALRALSGRTALLILDGAENTDDLQAVLAVRGNCGVLVTSRRARDAVEATQDVPPLPETEAQSLLQRWAGTYAADEMAGAQVCALVGYLPLAVRLVGRYLAYQKEQAADYLKWLQETPLEALDQGGRRDESVSILMDRSLAQVSVGARDTLAVAGLLALAPFERRVMAAGLDYRLDDTRGHLDELVDYGLLLKEGGRYQAGHALIHTYARRRLKAPEGALSRLGAYYTDLAQEESQKGLEGFTSLEAARIHFMTVLRRMVEARQWPAAEAMCWEIADYLDLQGHWADRLTVNRTGLAAAREIGDRLNEGSWLGSLGIAYYNLARIEEAIDHYEQALAISREIGDRWGEGSNLGNLGNAYADLGRMKEAIDHQQQALAISQETGDRHNEGTWLGNLGIAYASLGRLEEAIEHYEQALAISRETGNRRGEGAWLGGLGIAYAALGQMENAIDRQQQALAIAGEIGDRRDEGAWLGNLGTAYRHLGEVQKSIEHYQQALAISREIGDRRGESAWLGELGTAYRHLGRMEEAIAHYEQALAIAREIGYRRDEGAWLGGLGRAFAALGRMVEAIDHYQQALAIAREIGDRRDEGVWLGNLGTAYGHLERMEEAIDHCEEALAIAREIGDRRDEGTWLGNLGTAYRHLGRIEEAIDHYERALAITRVIGYRRGEGAWLGHLATTHRHLGRMEEAIDRYEQALAIHREIGNRWAEGTVLGNLGLAYADLGEVQKAIERYQQALAIFEEIRSPDAETVRRWLAEI